MSVDPLLELPPVLTVRQIAKRWQVSAYVVRVCIFSGELAGFRIGSRTMRVRADKLDEFELGMIAERLTPEEREARDCHEARKHFQWRLIKSAMLRRPKHVNAREARAAEARRQEKEGWDKILNDLTERLISEVIPISTLHFKGRKIAPTEPASIRGRPEADLRPGRQVGRV